MMKVLLFFLVCMSSLDIVDDTVRSKMHGYIDMLHKDLKLELTVFTYQDDLHQEYSAILSLLSALRTILTSFTAMLPTIMTSIIDMLPIIPSLITNMLPTPAISATVLAVTAFCAMFYLILQFRRELTTMHQEMNNAANGRSYLEHRLHESQEVNRFLLDSMNKMRTDIASLPHPTTPVPFDPEPYRAEYWDQYRYLYGLISEKSEAIEGIMKEHYYIHYNAYYHLRYDIDFLMSQYYRGQKESVDMVTQTSQPNIVPHGILRTSKDSSTTKKTVHFI